MKAFVIKNITKIKNTILFIAIWIFSYFLVDIFSYGSFLMFWQSLAIAILIVFLWKRIAKKYL